MVGWARAMFELLSSLTPRVTKGCPSFGRSAYGKPRRLSAARGCSSSVDDDGSPGRRPVPEPHHVAVGDVHAAMRAGVLPGGVIVRTIGAGTVAGAPGGVVD